jgi:hypothetical protein
MDAFFPVVLNVSLKIFLLGKLMNGCLFSCSVKLMNGYNTSSTKSSQTLPNGFFCLADTF